MNTLAYKKPISEFFSTGLATMASASASAGIVSKVAHDIFSIQLGSGAALMADALQHVIPPLSPLEFANSFWKMPTLYQTQARRMVKSLLDSSSTVLRGQQEWMALEDQACSTSIEQATQALSGICGAVASRRVTADVISFSDRRGQVSSEASFVEEDLVTAPMRASR